MSVFTKFTRADANEVEVSEAKRRQQEGAVLVDVREPYEWAAGHAPDSVHIPLGELAWRLKELPREGEVLFVCHSGNRSALAAMLARRSGIRRARNVRGGMIAWAQAHLPLAS